MDSGRLFLHPDEIEPICRHATDAALIVEIGTAFGGCACLFLMYSAGKVHSIDPFVRDSMGAWQSSAKQATHHVRTASERLNFDFQRWILHEQYSYEAVLDAPNNRADLIFIDGDHSYDAVRRDVNEWLPKLKKGGILMLHDARRVPGTPEKEFNQGWPGPTAVADELRSDPRVKLVEEVHSLVVWRKVK